MKVKLIADKRTGYSGFTVGKVYEVNDGWFHYLKDDDGDGRIIPTELTGGTLDWEIAE